MLLFIVFALANNQHEAAASAAASSLAKFLDRQSRNVQPEVAQYFVVVVVAVIAVQSRDVLNIVT